MKILKLILINIIKLKILRLIVRNIFEFLIVSWIVLTIVFFLINSIPSDSVLTSNLNEASKLAIEKKYGLDGTIIERYFRYIKNIFNGDLGYSTSFLPGVKINSFLWTRFATSFTVGILSLFITILIGIPLGIIVGRSPGKIMDVSSTIVISIVISIPSIIFAILLLISGRSLGIPYIYQKNNFISWILPALALGISPSFIYIKYIRTEMNREINSMHAKFAALKGISRTRFVIKHALKPSLYPIITFFPGAVLSTFLGGIFVESFFQIPGSGGLLVSSIQVKDYNIILILVTIYSGMTILAFSIRDILYKVLDPRVEV